MEEMSVTVDENILLTYKEPWLLENLRKKKTRRRKEKEDEESKKITNWEKQIKIVIMNTDMGENRVHSSHIEILLNMNQVKTNLLLQSD